MKLELLGTYQLSEVWGTTVYKPNRVTCANQVSSQPPSVSCSKRSVMAGLLGSAKLRQQRSSSESGVIRRCMLKKIGIYWEYIGSEHITGI